MCGNGSDRTRHPTEVFGSGWQGWDPVPDEVAPQQQRADVSKKGIT
ncbi:MAG: DUF3079 domain-containing protein [Burkholderiaceae bacterium]|nr:DUF3079 domain-containing protein [Burkholderiaceae bacterium]